ncbi:MAG TPA: D-alanyl-D-alanine carboxypeptidase family protein [Burkholderiales bacterium]|nr:D-alanyl-D-alanine carboxypeptidase family protein [Burkholderiales bacterium]
MMKKLLFIVITLMVWVPVAQAAFNVPMPNIAADAYVLSDFNSGQILAGSNIHERIQEASLTKLMTAYLTFKALAEGRIKLDQMVTESTHAWKTGGSRMFIDPRHPVSINNLILGMITDSGNDAAVTLAETIGGTEGVFTQMMNEEAQQLGMHGTHFMNATGLPNPDHYTTVYDLTLLTRALIQNFPQYYHFFSVKYFTYNGITQPNRVHLLWTDPSVDGLKTGYTSEAGYCLIASADRNGMRLISVVAGTKSESARNTESEKLLNYGFSLFKTRRIYAANQIVTQDSVWKGSKDRVAAGVTQDIFLTLPRGQHKDMKATISVRQPLVAPLSLGEQIGTINLTLNGQPLASYPLVAKQAIPLAGFFGRMWDSMRLMWH